MMDTLYNMNNTAKMIVALVLILSSVILLFGIRIVAANICGKRAKLLNRNSQTWEFLAFIIPVISVVAIYNIEILQKFWNDVIKRIQKAIRKVLVLLKLIINKTKSSRKLNRISKIKINRKIMRILGWILTILGGILCFGALIMSTETGFVLDGSMVGSIGFSVALLVVGLLIINYKKTNK
jgi:hypothetical protein